MWPPYDPPGVGVEPPATELTQNGLVERGLAEVDRLDWDRFFVVADSWSIPPGSE